MVINLEDGQPIRYVFQRCTFRTDVNPDIEFQAELDFDMLDEEGKTLTRHGFMLQKEAAKTFFKNYKSHKNNYEALCDNLKADKTKIPADIDDEI